MAELAHHLINNNILIVEDDALIAIGLTSYLEGLGGKVQWETDVASALGYMAGGAIIDIAIVDLNLDGVMSDPVLDWLIAAGIFTIICTGYEEDSINKRFRSLPRSEKPFTRSKIGQLMASGVRRQPAY